MFEEVPRTRRGLARLTARHYVLGPFVIGGGVLLAAVGGSVAVATTVITASSIRISDVPPHPKQPPAVSATAHPAPPHQQRADHPAGSATTDSPSAVPPARRPAATPSSHSALTSAAPASSTGQSGAAPYSSGQYSSGQHGSGQPSASPSGSSSGPAGNALIYVTGYDPAVHRLRFQFAVDSPGAGPGGSDLYRVDSAQQYSATLATDLTITSGSRLCPPAGNRCSVDQLAAAAGTGFFAIAAIDPADQLHSVIEVDNAAAGSSSGTGFAPQATATPSPSLTRS
jgi:hypothetical protein